MRCLGFFLLVQSEKVTIRFVLQSDYSTHWVLAGWLVCLGFFLFLLFVSIHFEVQLFKEGPPSEVVFQRVSVKPNKGASGS